MAIRRLSKGKVLLKYDPRFLEKLSDKINPVLEKAAFGMAADIRKKAPYDPDSRRATGKQGQGFPADHHRDTIRAGQVNPNKWTPRKTEMSSMWGSGKTRLKSYYVLSFSGRGYWLEKGTKGMKGGGRKYSINDYAELTMAIKGRKGQLLIRRQYREFMRDNRVHYATKAQPHFAPAFRKWAKWVRQSVRSLV